MNETTTGDSYKEIPYKEIPDEYFFKFFIKTLDKLSNPNYLDAMEKIREICSKQNPNLN